MTFRPQLFLLSWRAGSLSNRDHRDLSVIGIFRQPARRISTNLTTTAHRDADDSKTKAPKTLPGPMRSKRKLYVFLRRSKLLSPINPVPSNVKDPGSGVTAVPPLKMPASEFGVM